MLLSNLFTKHSTPRPRFAPGLFFGLIIAFVILGQDKPVVGLAGLGTVLLATSVLIELNRERIWLDYRKSYRKQKGLRRVLSEPNMLYYNLNVVVLWPLILCFGIACLWAAYTLS